MSLLAETKWYPKIGAANSSISLEPQQLEIIAQKGDWYQVITDQGTGWIHPSPGVLINYENINASVNLKEDTLTYKYPDLFSPKVSIAPPQTLKIVGKWDHWLLASFENGNWWIDGAKLELQEPTEDTAPEAAVQ
ncbi:hypothetical protein D3C73_1216070 [compost metagenome]